jgi:hypothetical protein
MGEVFSFGAEERASLLETLSQRERPVWLRVVLHGDARALTTELGLRVWQGRVVAATPATLSSSRVLLRLAFARSGRIEVRGDEGPEPDLRIALPIRRALGEAEQLARTLEAVLAPLGGPGAVVLTRPERVVKAAAQLGKVALELANQLLDRPRAVGEVLSRSADDMAAARGLDQLRDLGVLEVQAEAALEGVAPVAGAGAPASGRPGVRSRPPTLRSRAPVRPRLLEVPEPADDDEPELSRALSDEPRIATSTPARPVVSLAPQRADELPTEAPPPELPTEPPPPSAPRLADDTAALASTGEQARARDEGRAHDTAAPRRPPSELDSGAARARPTPTDDELGLVDEPPPSRAPWILGALALLLLVLGVWWGLRTPDPLPLPVAVVDPPPPPAPIAPPPPTVRTATPTPSAYSLSRPPPLAGPEADRRLREAERLIQAGRYEEADQILAPLRLSRAEDPLVWLLTGTLELERGRFEDAAGAIDRAIGIDAKSYRGYILRGSIQQFQGSAQSAVQSYRTALAISPAHPMSPELREVTERLQTDAP